MYLRDLDKRKIDRKFVLTPNEFFNMFFGDYNVEENYSRLSSQQLFFILSDHLHYCSNSQVKLDNILTGKIILVGFDKGLVKAYYRPVLVPYKHCCNLSEKPSEECIDGNDDLNILELSLEKLITSLNDYLDDNEQYGKIYEEILLRAGIREKEECKILTKKN